MDDRGFDQDELDEVDRLAPHRRRRTPLFVVAIIVLLLLVVGGGFFAARSRGFLNLAPTPVPTATLAPGADLFYITTSPAWGTISIDGRTISHLPAVEIEQPLRLSPGIHQILWNANPFTPQSCNIAVPVQAIANACLANDSVGVPLPGVTPVVGEKPQLEAHVISFTASLSSLPDAQRATVAHAVQAYLDTLQSSETVQTGEQLAYLQAQANNFVHTATQPLQATLHFQLETNPNTSLPCNGATMGNGNGAGNGTCRSLGIDCLLFCPFNQFLIIGETSTTWDVYVDIHASFTYKTLDGRVFAQNQPDEANTIGTEYPLALSISWQNSKWHVTSQSSGIISANPFYAATTNLACLAAQNTINSNFSTFGQAHGVVNQVFWTFSSGTSAAQGCLAEASLQPLNQDTPTPTVGHTAFALCLFRFGVPLAANDLAHSYFPSLAVVSDYERGLAQELARHAPS